MPFFAVLISGLVGALASAIPAVVARVLVALGVGAIVYAGFDFLLDQIKAQVISNFNAIGGVSAQVIGILQIDTSVTIILSAYAIRLTYKFGAGALKQAVLK